MPNMPQAPVLRPLLLIAAGWLTSHVTEVTSTPAAVLRRGGDPGDSANPHAAAVMPSETTCAVTCAAQQPWFCRAMTYHASSGACRMFSSCPDRPPLEDAVDTSGEHVSYHRHQPDCPDTSCACPAGFSLCAGHCLVWLAGMINYPTAERLCAERGAHLVVPRTDAELQCIRAMADAEATNDVWLGVNDLELEGRFMGEDSCGAVAVPEGWWSENQPNGGTNENYVTSTPTGWFDSGPENIKNPLCQVTNCYRPQCLA